MPPPAARHRAPACRAARIRAEQRRCGRPPGPESQASPHGAPHVPPRARPQPRHSDETGLRAGQCGYERSTPGAVLLRAASQARVPANTAARPGPRPTRRRPRSLPDRRPATPPPGARRPHSGSARRRQAPQASPDARLS